MPVIFKIRGDHKVKNTLINDITKYIDTSSDNSYNSTTSPNKTLHKFIQYKLQNTDDNLNNVYDNLIKLNKSRTHNSISSDNILNSKNEKLKLKLIGVYETPNLKIKLKLNEFISKGAFGNVYNATLFNNTTQNSVLLNKHNNMDVRLSNIKELDVIVKTQVIKKRGKNHIIKILTEYLLHLFLCYNRKCSRFIPKLYCIYRYKSNIFFVMEKLNGILFHDFISINASVGSNNASVGSNNASVGSNNASVGSNNASVGTNNASVGSNNASVGSPIIIQKGTFKEKFISFIKQITMILFLLQKYFNFVHGDLKPNNIMLVPTYKKNITINGNVIPTHGYIVKIIDFGFSCIQSKTSNIIVPTYTYDNMICGKKYIDLLFMFIRIVRKYHSHKFKIPADIDTLLRNHIRLLLNKVNISESDILSIMGTSNKYNMEFINKSKLKVEYKIVYQLAINDDKLKNINELLIFQPKGMYKLFDNIKK